MVIVLVFLVVLGQEVYGNKEQCENHAVKAKLFDAICSEIKQTRTKSEETGTTYTRWGRTKCSGDKTEIVYSGFVGGASHNDSGSQVNMLCVPTQPQYAINNKKADNHPWLGGTIYSMHQMDTPNTALDQSKYTLYGIPCTVCRARDKTSVIMIPGRKECTSDWEKEYNGYLFGGNPKFKSGSEYVCIDEVPERRKKATSWSEKPILKPVHSKCNEVMPCPPFIDGRVLTCVVCSK
ncbi:Hypothetical predicted protein [Mytilus galloprovincialis]|uniref:Short-chain collagen C4-like n=1 Tax=Mytilus galloprovincialis TaxID=29158 RepID=A0A8B6DAM8_MYTGA|nr:Hypothetical predicted protein [Mytilus galloprovincialis]